MNRLEELRKENGLTQQELADKIGMTKRTIIAWEKAERDIKSDLLGYETSQFKGIKLLEDNVNKPSHYKGKYGLEAIDVVRNFSGSLTATQGFYWGNLVKYILRFQQKNGVEDLKKARKNLDWLIENLEEKHDAE